MKKETKVRGLPKNWIIDGYQNCRNLTEELKEKMTEYLLFTWKRRKQQFCMPRPTS